MRVYSIKELENFSGTKAHTIRIWEQRYELLKPKRTETGIRIYNDDDLKKILATAILIKSGFKISKVAKLSKEEMNFELSKVEDKNGIDEQTKYETYINGLLSAGVRFEEKEFISIFNKSQEKYDPYVIYIEIIYPLLVKIGTMWGRDDMNPLQEHFISNILRQKILIDIDLLPVNETSNNEIALFLPEKETHEIGLLLSNYLLKKAGFKTYYFGQQVPVINLTSFIEEKNIKQAVGFIFHSQGSEKLNKMLNVLTKKCPNTTFYWGGSEGPLKALNITPNHKIINSIDDFKNQIIDNN